ncbi:MAG: phosphoribosylformylglycinamidine synthase subunit PurS [Thermaerobacter sp.]|nr:phosphoribosylformylglycinamidine synthase subunit PurS [Thermaerobacter sp.]
MPNYRAELRIHLRSGVLDPAGEAVQSSLGHLGFAVDRVEVGKLLTVDLSASSPAEAEEALRRMAKELLVNPVLEDYDLEVRAR